MSDPLGRALPPNNMNETLTFGRWMKRLRAELDLTQEALAEAAGCAPQTIRTFESGQRRPSRDLAERLAKVLQVPPEQWEEFVRVARAPASPVAARPDQAAAPPDGQGAKTLEAAPPGQHDPGQAVPANDLREAPDQGQPSATPAAVARPSLPVPPTAIVGREREVGELTDLLSGR